MSDEKTVNNQTPGESVGSGGARGPAKVNVKPGLLDGSDLTDEEKKAESGETLPAATKRSAKVQLAERPNISDYLKP